MRFNRGRYARVFMLWLCTAAATTASADMTVKTHSVGHGVNVWYVENDTVPVVDLVLSFEGAGSASDPEGKAGRAAFTAAMLTEGAGDLGSVAFRRALEEKAIQMEFSTDEDRLRIHVYCLREHAVSAGKLLALALAKPQLMEADQARIKADMGSRLARLAERPDYHAERLLAQRGFRAHPYANAPYGDGPSLATLNTQDMRDYLATYVSPANLRVAASGDVDARALDAILTPVSNALAVNDAAAVGVTPTRLQGAGEVVRATLPVPQTTILFAAPGIARSDPKFYAAYLLNYILGGDVLSSRLGVQVRKQKGLVYGIDSTLDVKRGTSLLMGELATRNATAEEAMRDVKDVLENLRAQGVTSEECADAKSHVLGAFARQLDSNGAVANLLLSMQVHDLGEDYLERRAALFSAVRCADINAVAAELLDPARFLFAVVGGTPDNAGDGGNGP